MIPELRTLIAVTQHGTFAAAGDRLGLTQAGVSGHIRRLEEALGFRLFERTGRSARLNAEGLRTFERAKSLVAAFDALGEVGGDAGAGGSLRIGAISSVQSTILARAMVPFRARFPECRLRLMPGVSLHLVDLIDAGELDLAVVIRPTFDLPSTLAWIPLVTEDYALLVPGRAEGENWRDIITRWPFIRYDRTSLGGRQVDRFLRREGVVVNEWLEVDDLSAMVALVERDAGCAIVPMTEAVSRLPGNIRRMTLDPDAPSRPVGIVHQSPNTTAMVAELIACLVATR